jgi:hypothetical protein
VAPREQVAVAVGTAIARCSPPSACS